MAVHPMRKNLVKIFNPAVLKKFSKSNRNLVRRTVNCNEIGRRSKTKKINKTWWRKLWRTYCKECLRRSIHHRIVQKKAFIRKLIRAMIRCQQVLQMTTQKDIGIARWTTTSALNLRHKPNTFSKILIKILVLLLRTWNLYKMNIISCLEGVTNCIRIVIFLSDKIGGFGKKCRTTFYI